jgi:hypothetical protein
MDMLISIARKITALSLLIFFLLFFCVKCEHFLLAEVTHYLGKCKACHKHTCL